MIPRRFSASHPNLNRPRLRMFRCLVVDLEAAAQTVVWFGDHDAIDPLLDRDRSMTGAGKPNSRRYNGKPVSVGTAMRRRTHDLSGVRGHEVRKAFAHDFATALPHFSFTRRLNFEGREPVQNVMGVDFG